MLIRRNPRLHLTARVLLWGSLAIAFLVFVARLRQYGIVGDPLIHSYGELASAIIAFAFAGNALVRLRGLADRVALVLAISLIVAATLEGIWGTSVTEATRAGALSSSTAYLVWIISRTALALLFLIALEWEDRIPVSRLPRRDVLYALLLVGAVFYFTSAAFLAVSSFVRPASLLVVRHLWEFLLAFLFLIAACAYWKRLELSDSALDRAIWAAMVCSIGSELAMAQSSFLLDAPSMVAHLLKDASYAVLLGGSLLENGRLFDQVTHLAVCDPLTGLANFRRLIQTVETEIQRSGRTGHAFGILMIDMDGLKAINDQYGHATGNQALKKLAAILQSSCRTIDTAARYGGDEFAIVLPETSEDQAQAVAQRVRQIVAQNTTAPAMSVSVGVAAFPSQGATAEQLFSHADAALYKMKSARGGKRRRTHGASREGASRGDDRQMALMPSQQDSEGSPDFKER